MKPVNRVAGRAIPFGQKNVDTDVIISAKWLKTISREGLGAGAFESIRAQEGNIFDD
ncbi:MAG: 3-isopropylmalate dehydratase small subunit, partial [Parasphingorhabdus sp.]